MSLDLPCLSDLPASPTDPYLRLTPISHCTLYTLAHDEPPRACASGACPGRQRPDPPLLHRCPASDGLSRAGQPEYRRRSGAAGRIALPLGRPSPWRARDGGRRPPEADGDVLHGCDGRRRVEDDRQRPDVGERVGRLLRHRVDWRHRRGGIGPGRGVRRHRQRGHPQQRDPGQGASTSPRMPERAGPLPACRTSGRSAR